MKKRERESPPSNTNDLASFFGGTLLSASLTKDLPFPVKVEGKDCRCTADVGAWTAMAMEGDDVYHALLCNDSSSDVFEPTPNCMAISIYMGAPSCVSILRVVITFSDMRVGEKLILGASSSAAYDPAAMAPRSCEFWNASEMYCHGLLSHHSETCGPTTLQFPYTLMEPRICDELPGGQLEVVARHPIPRGTAFLYGGLLTPGFKDSYDGDYAIAVGHLVGNNKTDNKEWWDLEGGCVVRFINHFGGFRETGNIRIVLFSVRVDSGDHLPVVVFVATEDIPQGELVLACSYGEITHMEKTRDCFF